MKILKYALIRQWGFILITLLSIVAYFLVQLPTWWLAIVSIIIILVNETIEIRRSRHQKASQITSKLTKLAQDFQQRFVNTGSAYSIFYIIKELGNTNSEKQQIFKEWADGCVSELDFLTGWLHSFSEALNRVVEQKAKQEKELSERCNEFQSMNHSYYRLVETFYGKAKTGNIPEYIEKYYNDFVTEYNAFIQILRNTMDEARTMLHLNIPDPTSIGFAKELHIARWG